MKRALVVSVILAAMAGSFLTVWTFRKMGWLSEKAARIPATALAESGKSEDRPLHPSEELNVRIYEKLSGSVVNITTVEVSYDFFLDPVREQGTGSGSMLDEKGNILTNHHVIQNADSIHVTLGDKTNYRASVVGVDEVNDLAVLRIEAPPQVLKPIPVGTSSNLRVGQTVFAIGNPFGLTRTMTSGIISSLGRSIKTGAGFIIDDVIQTDAAINPGNSGGPLIDSQGKLIGVTTSIFTTSGGSIGIGFAVPVSTVVRVTNDILQYGKVRRPWIGIAGSDLSAELARYLRLPGESGVLVEYVEPGSSAAAAGVRGGNARVLLGMTRLIVGGDFITHVDGRPVAGMSDLTSYILNKRPGDAVKLTYYRDGRKATAEMALLERLKRERL